MLTAYPLAERKAFRQGIEEPWSAAVETISARMNTGLHARAHGIAGTICRREAPPGIGPEG
jgi:hypothetical protein